MSVGPLDQVKSGPCDGVPGDPSVGPEWGSMGIPEREPLTYTPHMILGRIGSPYLMNYATYHAQWEGAQGGPLSRAASRFTFFTAMSGTCYWYWSRGNTP